MSENKPHDLSALEKETTKKTKNIIKLDLPNNTRHRTSIEFSNDILRSLIHREYDPNKTVKIVLDYLKKKERLERILYSEISNTVLSYDLDDSKFIDTIDNAGLLMSYISDPEFSIKLSCEEKKCDKCSKNEACKLNTDCIKILIKIYDHIQLCNTQKITIKNLSEPVTKKIVDTSSDEIKKEIRAEIKDTEKEYITILGIFASIVLAFVGGLTFSSSVLSNIEKASPYRLITVICLIGFILLNSIYYLLKFLMIINRKSLNQEFSIKVVNFVIALVLSSTYALWVINSKPIKFYNNIFLYVPFVALILFFIGYDRIVHKQFFFTRVWKKVNIFLKRNEKNQEN